MVKTKTRIIQTVWTNSDRVVKKSPLWEYIESPVDLTFADPPYNYKVKYDSDTTKDKLDVEVYRYWIAQVIRKLAAMTKAGGMMFWLSPAEGGHWMWPLLNRYGTLLQGRPIIWHERFSQYQKKRLTSDYRMLWPLIVGSSEDSRSCCGILKPTFNPDDIREESVRQQMGDPRADPKGRVPGHVWQVSRLQGNAGTRVDWHPAQLPPAPLERIVKGWTNPGDTVLDAFAGGGSLGLVCKEHGRHFVGVEQSKLYCIKMRARLK